MVSVGGRWPAELVTAAVNSALQRARATLEERLPARRPCVSALTGGEERALLERYVRAWETTDVDEFTALLHEDALMSMPPWRQWYRGRAAIVAFVAARAGLAATRRSGSSQ